MKCIPNRLNPLTTYDTRNTICSDYSEKPHNKCVTETNGECKYVDSETAENELDNKDEMLSNFSKKLRNGH